MSALRGHGLAAAAALAAWCAGATAGAPAGVRLPGSERVTGDLEAAGFGRVDASALGGIVERGDRRPVSGSSSAPGAASRGSR